jgi:hypothetical protein
MLQYRHGLQRRVCLAQNRTVKYSYAVSRGIPARRSPRDLFVAVHHRSPLAPRLHPGLRGGVTRPRPHRNDPATTRNGQQSAAYLRHAGPPLLRKEIPQSKSSRRPPRPPPRARNKLLERQATRKAVEAKTHEEQASKTATLPHQS